MEGELGWLRSELLGEDEVRRAAAYTFGVPFVVLERSDINLDAMLLIPEPLSRTRNAVAYARGEDGSVEVALLDLADLEALEFLKPLKIKPRLTTRASMKQALLHYQKHLKEKFETMLKNGAQTVEGLLRHALLSGATHIHIEPALTGALVRYRISGLLSEAVRLSKEAGDSVVERLKQLARLFPVATAAQEGAFKFDLPAQAGHEEGPVSVSVSTMPTVRGEKMLLRLAHERRGQSGFTLTSLGFHGRSLEHMHALLSARRGLLFVSGPEGSGKTTLLYTLLDTLASPALSLASVEAHIAHRLPGAWQTQIRPEIGLTVASAVRAALRTDPDVLMVDAVDSPDAAQAARAGARRGVFIIAAEDNALVETPDATVELQLMHRICPHCRQAIRPSRTELHWFEEQGARFAKVLAALKEEGVLEADAQWKDVIFYRPQGCAQCERGFQGYIGIQSILPGAEAELSLLEDALFKAAAGLVSLEEIISL